MENFGGRLAGIAGAEDDKSRIPIEDRDPATFTDEDWKEFEEKYPTSAKAFREELGK